MQAADKPVRRILWRKSARVLGLPQDAQAEEESWEEFQQRYGKSSRVLWELEQEYGWTFATVVETYPGSGKSRDASDLVNEAWKQGKKGLYIMLSNDPAIEERLKRLRKDGRADNWHHWRGHKAWCVRGVNGAKGFKGYGKCNCNLETRHAVGPTLLPIDLVLPTLPLEGQPTLAEVNRFDFWIVDEIDFSRFIGKATAYRQDIQVVADTYPNKAVQVLCDALGKLLDAPSAEPLGGNDLYRALGEVVEAPYRSLEALVRNLPLRPMTRPWKGLGKRKLRYNFPPVLVPVLREEASLWLANRHFNPRVTLYRDDTGTRLRVLWRRGFSGYMAYGEPHGYFPPNTFLLDATANADLLEKVFPEAGQDVFDVPIPEWPKNVYVHQWADDLVSMGTLAIPPGASAKDIRPSPARERWYRRIEAQLRDFDRNLSIGIITHKAIEREAVNKLRAWGFTKVHSLHYGGDRGSNALEKVHVLVLLGLPIPHPTDFIEEAQAFLYDSGPLDFSWQKRGQQLLLRGGGTHQVGVSGYWAEPVASYYWQKCQAGLYQALHRIRPYLRRRYGRHIFIFTNMPIKDVVVDHIMQDERKAILTAREARAIRIIGENVGAKGVCAVPELAKAIAEDGENPRTVATWLKGNADRLAALSGTEFIQGKGKRPGRFARRPS